MNRKEEQAELMYKLGLLVSPLSNIVQNPDEYDASSRTRAGAKFFADLPEFQTAYTSFTRGEAGHKYDSEWQGITVALAGLQDGIRKHLNEPEVLSTIIDEKVSSAKQHILAIPTSIDSEVLMAYTPFSTYCALKDLCQTVGTQLAWVDRYMDAGLFYRYLRDVDVNVGVILVTWPEEKRDATEWEQFLEVSRLYAAERGIEKYRLVVHTDGIHDRWLYSDGEMYLLGGSVKDAGRKSDFTVSRLEVTQDLVNCLAALLNTGTELFGPSNPDHP